MIPLNNSFYFRFHKLLTTIQRIFNLSLKEYLLAEPVVELFPSYLRKSIRHSSINFILNLNAATLPSQISCIGIASGNGMAFSTTSRFKAMQQPTYAFFINKLKNLFFFAPIFLKNEGNISFSSAFTNRLSLTTQSYPLLR